VAPVAPVLRGLLIAVPVAIVFVALFSAADAVFARIVGNIFGLEIDLGDAGWRMALAAALAWVAAGAIGVVGSDAPAQTADVGRAGWRIGATEVVTVLVVVNAIFAVFVALQAAYLFGGLDTLELTGLTYAAYARRGFLELVAVAVLVGTTVLVLEALVQPRTRRYVVAALALTGLTGVVLASAALRLRLYQEAYGWTELRFYVLTAIVFLALGLLLAIRAIIAGRSRRLLHGFFALGLTVALAANVIGPVRFVTDANLERALHPELVPPNGSTGLDVDYLVVLDTDAVGPLVDALPDLDPALRRQVEATLSDRDVVTSRQWQDWSLSRLIAASALERIEGREGR
jgi:Domain of unknown function (DUF4173)